MFIISELKNLTGIKFGKLTVTKRVENTPKGGARWLCKCDCGNEKEVASTNLLTGRVKSCGCFLIEHGKIINLTHGMSHSSLHNIWKQMRHRCVCPGVSGYENYGARGISVCQEWQNNFENFYDWSMKNGYKEGLSIDRIDNDGNYEPSNCRWTDRFTQANNRRNCLFVIFNGKKMTVKELSRITDIDYEKLRKSYHKKNISTILPNVKIFADEEVEV